MNEPIKVSLRTNRWAIVSILCSLCILILPIVMLGPLLAIIALSSIRHNPEQRGKILAIIAICIGCLVTVGYAAAGYWWNTNVRMPMLYGPSNELRGGFQNDFTAFRSGFYGDGANAPDSEISLLISNLRNRYGNFVAAEQMSSNDSSISKDQDLLNPQISYILEFERKQVSALADFLVIDPSQRKFAGKFKWIIILDDELGDLIYPASAEEAIRNFLESLEQIDNGN
ncbi:MAG: DUF4190 domain-containing protein [Planctomycetes bacterium]|nr:DUF4190 domain-containing protein [Planctomycetota bacterium]